MKKINNKILLILFCVLAVIALVFYLLDRQKGERSFRSELFTVDSAAVTSITIYPKGNPGNTIRLVKTGKDWEVKDTKASHPADTNQVRRIIGALCHVSAERVAGSDPSSWKDLQLTDSASTRIVVEQGNEVTADFRVGKISFPRDNGMNPYGRNRNFSVKSHVRVAGDDRAYVVDGFLSMMLGDQISTYRNKTVYKFDKNLAEKLTFTYPGDSSFVLVKQNSKWTLNGQPADSASVENYLNSTATTTHTEYADNETVPFAFPFSLRIEGNNMAPVNVSGAADVAGKKYFFRSTFNQPETFFASNPSLFNRVFPGRMKFLESKTKPGTKESRKKK